MPPLFCPPLAQSACIKEALEVLTSTQVPSARWVVVPPSVTGVLPPDCPSKLSDIESPDWTDAGRMIVVTMSTGLVHDSTAGAKVMLPVVATGGSVGNEDVTLGVGDGLAVVNGLDWAVELFRLMPMMSRPKTMATTTTTPMIAATKPLLTPGPEGAYP